MKKQLLSSIALTIAFGISPQIAYAQTHSHLSDEELQKLMPDFQRQVEYWNQYEEPERQKEAKVFAENWSQRDPTVAPFLGSWAAIEETMDIYPSTTEGQVCIISAFSTPNPEVELSLGKVLNQRIYNDAGSFIIQEGNYVGIAGKYENKTSIYVYRLIAPAEVPSNSSLSAWRGSDRVIEQFHAAGCIAEASNEALEQKQIDASAVSARICTRELRNH
jgi:hypothetical protein